MFSRKNLSCFLLFIGVIFAAGCSGGSKPDSKPTPTQEKFQLTGDNAWLYMRRDSSRAQSMDTELQTRMMSAVMKGTQGLASLSKDEQVAGYMMGQARMRRNFRAEGYPAMTYMTPPEGAVAPARAMAIEKPPVKPMEVREDNSDHIYVTIPKVYDSPVRNQGSRGTCGAHSAIAALEYNWMNLYARNYQNFSIQRFYYLGKPECQSDGCPQKDPTGYFTHEGLWPQDGYSASIRHSYYDIPLASDCPYNPNLGDNALQVPQASGCENGVIGVDYADYFSYSWSDIEYYINQGKAIPIVTWLTKNYDNLGGYGSRDNVYLDEVPSDYENYYRYSPHAIIIVGYWKYYNGKTEHGDDRFVQVKNSWGTGWGWGGYKWMAWSYFYKFARYKYSTIPSSFRYGSPLNFGLAAKGAGVSDQTVLVGDDFLDPQLDPDINADGTIDKSVWLTIQEPASISVPAAQDVAGVTNWKTVDLAGPGNGVYRAELGTSNGVAYIRAIIRGSGIKTGAIALGMDDQNHLVFNKNIVGRIAGDGAKVWLCSGEYDPLCGLRLDPGQNRLYAEFLYEEQKKFSSDNMPINDVINYENVPAGEWVPFATINGINVERLATDTREYAYFRVANMKSANQMKLDGNNITYQGTRVGTVEPPTLCSGDYREACLLFQKGIDLELVVNW